jgi:lysophospholipase L1-like esterase
MTEKLARYLALGDSYTIGEGVTAAERWPVRLAARLRALGRPLADPEIIAQTGWTTDELAAAIAAADPQGPFDLVSLLIGVNNQYRGRSPADYAPQFSDLLQQALTFAGGRSQQVLVLSIPDWGVTPFAAGRDQVQIRAEIDAYNAINRAQTEQMGSHYVDITPLSRQAATNPDLLAADGLHPSGKMYAAWVELILESSNL